jgi:hypothetical protein
MTRSYPDALALSRTTLRALIKLNLLAGALILILLIATLVAEEPVMRALGADASSTLFLGMRMIMVIGIYSVPIAHVVLTLLLQIVETVRTGNPFVPENARRLQIIAWAMLTLQILHLVVGAIAKGVSSAGHPLDINWSFSFTQWIAVLMLFVLARVFEVGARMREDLEGTV